MLTDFILYQNTHLPETTVQRLTSTRNVDGTV